MNQDLYSVEQVADLLGLHVRTVRTYVREGRLKAVRIGKQYRIAREDLAELTGQPVSRTRHVEVSTIVEIDAIRPDSVDRITNLVMSAADTRRAGEPPARIETVYDAERARLKVIVIGSMDMSASVFKMISLI